jgi:PIN domain nuclease of toxin-antitoxin system
VESYENKEEEMILLDTNAIVWLSAHPEKLSSVAASAIRRAVRAGDRLAISAISLWELAWLIAHGEVDAIGTVEVTIEELTSRFSIRPITPRIAAQASQFGADYPKDPGDRIIGATALIEGSTLITSDAALRRNRYVRTLW